MEKITCYILNDYHKYEYCHPFAVSFNRQTLQDIIDEAIKNGARASEFLIEECEFIES